MGMFASRVIVVDSAFPNPNMKNVAALIRMMSIQINPKTLDTAIIVASTFRTIIHIKANEPPGTVLAAAVINRARPSPDGTRIYGIIAVGRVPSNASVLYRVGSDVTVSITARNTKVRKVIRLRGRYGIISNQTGIVNIASSPVSNSALIVIIATASGDGEPITMLMFITHFRFHTNHTEDNQTRVMTNRYGIIFCERSIP